MAEQLRRVLILDSDPDTLIALQGIFEDAKMDTTITWDKAEACQLIETVHYDLLLIGNHPPELDPTAIIESLSYRGICPAVLILQTGISQSAAEHFRKVGATGTISKRDSSVVLEHVKTAFARMPPTTERKTIDRTRPLLRAS